MPEAQQGATPETTPTATVTIPATTGATPATATLQPAPQITPDTAAQLAELQLRLASADARIKELNKESRDHRLKAEGVTGTTEQERAELDAYRAYGKPDELKARLEREAQLSTEKATRERQDGLRKVAEGLGLKPNSLFLRLADGLEFTTQEADGKTVYSVQQGDKSVPFEQWAQSNEEWRDALPAMQNNPTPTRPQAPIMGAGRGETRPVEPRRPVGYSL